MVPDIEEEDRVPRRQKGFRKHRHPAVTRSPSMHENRHRPTTVLPRLNEPTPEGLPQRGEGVLSSRELEGIHAPEVGLLRRPDQGESHPVQGYDPNRQKQDGRKNGRENHPHVTIREIRPHCPLR